MDMIPVMTSDTFESRFSNANIILTEGAIGVRLRSEFGITSDEHIANAGPIYSPEQAAVLKQMYRQYMDVAVKYHLPILVSTPTRRSNKDRIAASKFYDRPVIQDCVSFLKAIRDDYPQHKDHISVTGLMGCKGDAYNPTDSLDLEEAFQFHSWQANQFREAGADCLMAGIMPALPEAIGMAKAMESTGLPYFISFMIRENGLLMDGTPISDAIESIDGATDRKPVCYMANCVHPTVLASALHNPVNQTVWVRKRFLGIQANASALSPEALDGAKEPQGDSPERLAEFMADLKRNTAIKIFGGCCGTDHRHMDAIALRLTSHI